MASTRIYTVVKDGEELEKLKTLTAAKKLADTEGAEVYCEGECVYHAAVEVAKSTVEVSVAETVPATSPDTASEEAETPVIEEKKAQKGTAQYRLTSLMNVRRTPSLDAEKAGTKDAGAVVDVAAVENDWLHLADGSFILYGGGKFAEKI